MGCITMPHSENTIWEGLEACLEDILHGQIDPNGVGKHLDDLLSNADPLSDLHPYLLSFCEKVLALVLKDQMPYRANMLAELAARVARWSGAEWGISVVIACAYRLLGLEQFEAALSVLGGDDEFAPYATSLPARLVDVLRLRCLDSLGRTSAADACVARYESSEQALPNDQASLDLLLQGALAASAISKHDVALQRSSRARDIYDHVRTQPASRDFWASRILAPLSAARIHTVRGVVLRQSGDTIHAIEEFQIGREQAKAAGDARRAAIFLSEIGISWERMAETDRGRRILLQAATEAEDLGEVEMAARWRNTLVVDSKGLQLLDGYNGLAVAGARLRDAGNRPDAEAEAITKRIIGEAHDRDKTLEAAARNLLAYCYSLRGHFHQALAQVTVAIQVADSGGDRWSGMIFRGNRANLAIRANHFAEAEQAALEAVERAATFRTETSTSEVRQAAAAAVVNASEVLLMVWGLEMVSSTGDIRSPRPDKIVELSQKIRSRNFDHWLALMNWASRDMKGRLGVIARNLIEAEISVEAAAQGQGSLSTQLQILDRASKTLSDSHLVRAQAPLPDEMPGLEDAIGVLEGDDVVLDLNPVQSGLICIVAGPRRRTECFEIPWGRDARADWINRWRLVSCGPADRSRRTRRQQPVEESADFMADKDRQLLAERLLKDLEDHFVQPIYEQIAADIKRIVCSIHSELSGIPIWSLGRDRDDLILSVVPSITSISLLARRPPSRGTRFIKIGDATETLAMVPMELDALKGFDLIEPDRSVLSGGLSEARRIHFAGHGDFIEENPYLSGVVVRGEACDPYAVPDFSRGCIRLTLQGLIHDWDVTSCDLAVLSACSTGVPRVHPASEFTSVSAALLVAGARNVIAASWPADDVATMLLMRRFYELLECDPRPAHALAKARQSLKKMRREVAAAIVGDEEAIPHGETPFSSALFTDTFLHFGIG
jgi:tetratricopeptide (TPR) repeat protein